MPGEPDVIDNTERHRFEARLDGELVGIAEYRLGPDTITFTHTEVADAAEGSGVGSALAGFALGEARARELGVIPQCPFIRGWIERHPEAQDLVVEGWDVR